MRMGLFRRFRRRRQGLTRPDNKDVLVGGIHIITLTIVALICLNNDEMIDRLNLELEVR